MKKILRMLFVLLLLAGSMSTIAVAGGTDPPADCDPFSNPHCPLPPLAVPGR